MESLFPFGPPRLLDLFCGAGGASAGYHAAGFEVVGVDINPEPNYPYTFIQGDALKWGREYECFQAIHASPPCQAHSSIGAYARRRDPELEHRDLIEPTRDLLIESGLPYVIENVEGAPLLDPVTICGSSVGLDVKRHRLFETNWPLLVPPCAHGWQTPRFRSLDKRRKVLASVVGVHGHLNYAGEKQIRERAMDIDWMTPAELAQAIPPAYTELIGHQLLQHALTRVAA